MTPSTGRRTLLITGAAGRLGVELIKALGGSLDVIALTHRKSLQLPSEDITVFEFTGAAHCSAPVRSFECDLTNEKELRLLLRIISTLGPRVDYVINSAGDLRFLGPTTEVYNFLESARRQMELHVFVPALIGSVLFKEQWKHIPVERQRASILNISSISGSRNFVGSGQGFYAASKAATNMLTLHMAADYGKYGIRVNALCPDTFSEPNATKSVADHALKVLFGNSNGGLFA